MEIEYGNRVGKTKRENCSKIYISVAVIAIARVTIKAVKEPKLRKKCF